MEPTTILFVYGKPVLVKIKQQQKKQLFEEVVGIRKSYEKRNQGPVLGDLLAHMCT